MAKPVESQLTISCLQCDWSVETVNTPAQVSSAFLEAALSHTDAHPQHALEVVQRLRIYSENYVEPEPSAPEQPPTGYAYAGCSYAGCARCRGQARHGNPDRLSGQVSS